MVSQNNEAEIIINYFNGYKGSLLSLGENDGITLSNSYDLIQLGWIGDLVEPAIEPFKRMSDRYKDNDNVRCHNFGIANDNGRKLFYQTEDSLLSSLDKSQAEQWGSKITEVFLDFVTFEYAHSLELWCKTYDFISIDCEGMDFEILKQMDLTLLKCKCICIEYGKHYDEIKSICNKFGLSKQLLRNCENVIYAR